MFIVDGVKDLGYVYQDKKNMLHAQENALTDGYLVKDLV
jgi:hypothetical protein